jgi:hypothetical protein
LHPKLRAEIEEWATERATWPAQELALAQPDRVASLVLWSSFPAPDGFHACGLAAVSHPCGGPATYRPGWSRWGCSPRGSL